MRSDFSASDRVVRASDDVSSVTSSSPVVSRPIAMGGASHAQISLLLVEFSIKVSGAVDAIVQTSNDRQNWQQIGVISAAFDKAGTVQTATYPIATKYVRVATQASPAGCTVSFSLDVSLTSL